MLLLGVAGLYLGLWALYFTSIPRFLTSCCFNYRAGYGRTTRPTSIHISHRGGSAERVENTLSAFDHAVACGTQHLELDVYRTKDNVIIVNHDAILDRMAAGARGQRPRELNYAELPLLRLTPDLPPGFHPPASPLSWSVRPPAWYAVFNSLPETQQSRLLAAVSQYQGPLPEPPSSHSYHRSPASSPSPLPTVPLSAEAKSSTATDEADGEASLRPLSVRASSSSSFSDDDTSLIPPNDAKEEESTIQTAQSNAMPLQELSPAGPSLSDLPTHLHALIPEIALAIRIPTLREVFQRYPDHYINIDCKENDDVLINSVIALVKEFRRENRCVWGNFSPKVCEKLYRADPTVPIMFSSTAVLKAILLHALALLPYMPIKETCMQVPLIGAGMRRFLQHALRQRGCLSRGVHWSYWVIDTPEDFTKAFNLGVDAVMTDSPAMLAAWLDVNRPTWRSACTYSQEPKYASGTTATPSIAGINTAETRDVAITT